MASWAAASAKAKFSELLDTVEAEGLQLVQRRKRTFILTTQEEMDRRLEEARRGSRQGFVSAWGAMRPKSKIRFEGLDVERDSSPSRNVDL